MTNAVFSATTPPSSVTSPSYVAAENGFRYAYMAK